MNFVIDPTHISLEDTLNNIRFLEKKQNIIMQGEFTKIMYSTDIFTMNGAYLLCYLHCSDKPNNSVHSYQPYHKQMIFFHPTSQENQKIVSYFHLFEKKLIDLYLQHIKLYHPYSKIGSKTPVYSLYNQLNS